MQAVYSNAASDAFSIAAFVALVLVLFLLQAFRTGFAVSDDVS